MYWQRKSPLGVQYFVINQIQRRLRAAIVPIIPGFTNDYNNSFFVYLGTHETGHTLDLGDCLASNNCQFSTGHSIMGDNPSLIPTSTVGGPCSVIMIR
jgi:hypothetical protein